MLSEELPPSLRARLESFPTSAIRDDVDRAAAAAVEMELAGAILAAAGTGEREEHELRTVYLRALHEVFERAGKWSPPRARVRRVDITWSRPWTMAQVLLDAGRVAGPAAAWVTNRRVAWRRRRWRRLLG